MLYIYEKVREQWGFFWSDWYSKFKSTYYKDLFPKIKTFCLFIGYPRSGHSLVGSLLDAHPNILIANELDVLKYFTYGLQKDQIFYLLMQNSKRFASRGRTQTGYKYDVPGQWQGKFSELQVIGDKKGGMTTQRIGKDYDLLQSVPKKVGMPVKYIHVIRNPFDNITTMALRTNSTLEKEIDHYFQLSRINQDILNAAGSAVLNISHEDIISNPGAVLRQLSGFIGVSCSEAYVRDCSKIVRKKPSKTRQKLTWSEAHKARVYEKMKRYPFLKDYDYTT